MRLRENFTSFDSCKASLSVNRYLRGMGDVRSVCLSPCTALSVIDHRTRLQCDMLPKKEKPTRCTAEFQCYEPFLLLFSHC